MQLFWVDKKKNKKFAPVQDQQFADILGQIQSAKKKAYQQVNKALVEFYWNIGSYISSQMKVAKWGRIPSNNLRFLFSKEILLLTGSPPAIFGE